MGDEVRRPRLSRPVANYADAIGVHGIGSPEAIALRAAHSDDEEFQRFADALDRIKQTLCPKPKETH